MNRQHVLLAAVTGTALLVGAALWLPARWLEPLLPKGVTCARLAGSAWRGRCEGLGIRGSRSGTLEWSLHPGPLLSLTLVADVRWRSADSAIAGLVRLHRGGVGLEAVAGSVSLQTIRNAWPAAVSLGPLAAVDAQLATRGFSLRVTDRRVLAPSGLWQVRGLRLLRSDTLLGDFVAEFASAAANEPVIVLRDRGGPLALDGKIRLLPEFSYSGRLRATPRDPSIVAALGSNAPVELSIDGRL